MSPWYLGADKDLQVFASALLRAPVQISAQVALQHRPTHLAVQLDVLGEEGVDLS